MGVVAEAIQRALRQDRVFEQRDPLFDGAIAGEDGRGPAVAFEDDLVDIAGLGQVEPAQAEVIDDQQIGSQKATDRSLPRVVGLGLEQFEQHPVSPQEEDAVAGATGGMTEAAGEQGLSDADRSDEEDILRALEEAEAEEIADAMAIEGHGRVPVEVFQRTDLLEVGSLEADGEVVLFSAVDFILEDQLQEVRRAQFRLGGIGHPIRKGGQDAGELQALENGFEGWLDLHGGRSPLGWSWDR